MSKCPGEERWLHFLEDKLSHDEEESCARHLEACPECVQILEALTSCSREVTGNGAQRRLGSSLGLDTLRDLLPASESHWEELSNGANMPTIPGYVIERELGRGGMGIVYLAWQTQLHRRVALKVVLAGEHAAQEVIVRFLAEAQTCAALRHEHIVQIFDIGHHAGLPYYSMEYIDGPNLSERVRAQPLSPRESAALIEQICRAIYAAHQQGVIHRDLKPANILLLPSVDNGKLIGKISDFGLAKRFEQESGLTQTAAFLGTPDYMAPEQFDTQSRRLDPRVDVFALGAVLYFLLIGRPPFAAATPLQTLTKARNEEPESPSVLRRDVPRDLATICLHCLEKHPNRRYPTADALAADLARFLSGEPIVARPVTEWERLRKWATRNPAISTLSILLLMVVFVALGVVTQQWYIAEHARERESARADEVRLLSASYAIDRGVKECQEGDVDAGLSSFLQALELVPESADHLEFSLRMNLGAWRERRCPVKRGTKQGTTVRAVAFSPNGATILSGNSGDVMGNGSPGEALLWDARSIDKKPQLKIEYDGRVECVAYSPDGRHAAVGGTKGVVAVHDLSSGLPCFPPLHHAGAIHSVVYRPDGKQIAGVAANELRIWNAETGEQVCPPIVIPFQAFACDWHCNGNWLALGGSDPDNPQLERGVAIIYDLEAQSFHKPMLQGGVVKTIAFQPRSNLLAIGCQDGVVRLWDAVTANVSGKPLVHSWPVNSLQFNADGELLATASGRSEPGYNAGHGEVNVWEIAKRTRLLVPQYESLPQQSQNMRGVAFSPNDHQLAAVSENGAAWLWSLPPLLKPRLSFKFSDRADVLYSPDGKHLLLTMLSPRVKGFRHQPSVVHLVNTVNGEIVAELPHEVSVKARFSRDSKNFVTLNYTTDLKPVVHCWNSVTGGRINLPPDFGPALKDVFFPIDGCSVFTFDANGEFRRWDTTTWQPSGSAIPCLLPEESVEEINRTGTRVLAVGPNGARLISLPDCRPIAQLSSDFIHCGTFIRQDAEVVLVTNLQHPQVQRFDAQSGTLCQTQVPAADRYQTILHHGFGRFLLDLSLESSSQFWDNATGLTGARFPVCQQVAIHPSRNYLASTEGGTGDKMQLWSFVGKPLGPPLPHAFLYAVEFDPQGDELVTSAFDGSVNVWQLPLPLSGSAKEIRESLPDLGAPK